MFAKGGKSLTLGAGGALQSLPADAAERVSINHTGPSVLTGVWQTAAVLRWRCKLTVSPPEKKNFKKFCHKLTNVAGGPLPACWA